MREEKNPPYREGRSKRDVKITDKSCLCSPPEGRGKQEEFACVKSCVKKRNPGKKGGGSLEGGERVFSPGGTAEKNSTHITGKGFDQK